MSVVTKTVESEILPDRLSNLFDFEKEANYSYFAHVFGIWFYNYSCFTITFLGLLLLKLTMILIYNLVKAYLPSYIHELFFIHKFILP